MSFGCLYELQKLLAMVKGKLILICQSGGEFISKDDGSFSYDGGEANAITINPETVFDDLMLKLAELLNFDHKSLSVKYFLPGNRRTLITLSNDRDLKRMYDFHEDAVTADVFVTGKVGFQREVLTSTGGREKGIKLAETVPAYTGSQAAATTKAPASRSDAFTNSDEPSDANLSPDSPASSPIRFDISSTPADTVKKRRRVASHKKVASSENVGKRRKSVSRKKYVRKRDRSAVDDDMDQEQDYDSQAGDSIFPVTVDNSIVSAENTVAAWKDGITGVGQEFNSVHEFRDALHKYAIAHRFKYRLKKNEKSRASGTCTVEGCSWRIYASWVPSEEVFKIKKMNKTHTCGGESRKAAQPTRSWLVGIIKDKLRENPHCKTKEITESIHRDFGIELNYTQVWRGVLDARERLQGSYKEAYNQLPWFCDKLSEANPGSFVQLSIGDDKRFQNLFVSFQASVHGFQNGCRPLLFLDSTSLKSKHRETLLTATAVDGNDGAFPVAFAIVDIENDDKWHWFLEQLRSAVSTSQTITFVTDKQKGLMKSVLNIFENAHHGYSIFHLLDEFMISLKGPFHGQGKSTLPVNFLAAAQAARLDVFRNSLEQIKRVSLGAYEWLIQIEPEYWTNAVFNGESYHQITFDVAESYANWVEEVRERPLIKKLETILGKMMELMNNRLRDSSGWSTKLTPVKEEKLKEETHKARLLRVLFSSETLFEVHNDSTNVVDMDKQSCSCLEWKVTGLPCRHAIAVFNVTKRSVYDYCSRYFNVDMYHIAYSKSINPVAGLLSTPADGKSKSAKAKLENADVLPPSATKSSSQQKRKRKRDGLIERTVTCTKCLGVGHNKVSCKQVM
ncbi:hypothetical protein Pint_13820 [Pistacia integerrima]|uniref:Uncharacterized protein n=1 Tax=Pistacia integerrima TaxID=434235 RepID=A0ACC0Y791_9ROSI|nr:hypothetical protein Pint_13820 [Pistacia integerrima]